MIESLRLRNFKCFEDQTLSIGGLTLLSGLNGSGKSSVLQSFLLLRQSWQQGLLAGGRLALNGELVQIGTAKDALYGGAKAEQIGISLVFKGGKQAVWEFVYDSDADVLSTREGANAVALDPTISSENLFSGIFQYLCAERLGPRTSFTTSDFAVRHHRQLGPRGEFTAHYLTSFGQERIQVEAIEHPKATSNRLYAQVEAWMDVISPGTRIKLTSHAAMDLVQLQYQFVSGTDLTDPYRPTNVGFGLTYTLPILVAILAARPGSLVLIENPEAHLHPRGQARMGELLALAASGGIQVILETHSDHVLNGVRVAVHENLLAPEQAKIHFFNRRDVGDRALHEVVSPTIDRDGRIEPWPTGFFDEWDAALDRLLTRSKR